mmetsp:Transcript_34210/g.103287  ORF Transcript_34210/g.103287 Transcript_34210/m.103287 type:complete len:267 (+) Transcript_34210:133-933(+)
MLRHCQPGAPRRLRHAPAGVAVPGGGPRLGALRHTDARPQRRDQAREVPVDVFSHVRHVEPPVQELHNGAAQREALHHPSGRTCRFSPHPFGGVAGQVRGYPGRQRHQREPGDVVDVLRARSLGRPEGGAQNRGRRLRESHAGRSRRHRAREARRREPPHRAQAQGLQVGRLDALVELLPHVRPVARLAVPARRPACVAQGLLVHRALARGAAVRPSGVPLGGRRAPAHVARRLPARLLHHPAVRRSGAAAAEAAGGTAREGRRRG